MTQYKQHARARGLIVMSVLWLSMPLVISSCGGDEEAGQEDTAQLPSGNDGGAVEQDVDSFNPVTDVGLNPDTGSSLPDIPDQDLGEVCTSFGCACSGNDQCDSGHCIDSPEGQICTKTCTDACPNEYKCVTTSGVDGVSICVPKFGNICAPCKENSNCQTTGNMGAKCVDLGVNGAFCGQVCDSDDDCPSNYKCDKDAVDITGGAVKQCVLTVGACACSKVAIAQEYSTKCTKIIGDAACVGERRCLADGKPGAPPGGGLTACEAKDPEPEICDGKDNDCDAQTDESTCEDNNECTLNDCAGSAGCVNSHKTGPCNFDDSECTENDMCKDGKCVSGPVKNCDDKNACTKDVCDPKKGCVYTALADAPCDADNNECTVNDTCKLNKDGKSICTAGDQKSCNSGDPCSKGTCLASTGKCKYTSQNGFPCDDGDPCSINTKCEGEICKGVPNTCDDNNPCTNDKCEAKTGCVHANLADTTLCDDGKPCTVKTFCLFGKCQGGKANLCDDNNSCTKDSCDPLSGCAHAALDAVVCDDGDSCTGPDTCVKGTCVPGKALCLCSSDADCKKLEDGDACTGTLVCVKGKDGSSKCDTDPATVPQCNDAEDCTADTCNKVTGACSHQKLMKSCDDGDVCTVGDACGDNSATGKYTCMPGNAKSCDDGVPCTVDTCDPKKGCSNISAVGKNVSCYTGPVGTASKGICHAGTQTCKDDGTLTACTGEVKPTKEICGNKANGQLTDDNCDGTVDEACGPTVVLGNLASAVITGKAGSVTLRGAIGASQVVGTAKAVGASKLIELGLYRWLSGLLK